MVIRSTTVETNIDAFFAFLDFHLAAGEGPAAALQKTVEDYAVVYHRPEGSGDSFTWLDRMLFRANEYNIWEPV